MHIDFSGPGLQAAGPNWVLLCFWGYHSEAEFRKNFVLKMSLIVKLSAFID